MEIWEGEKAEIGFTVVRTRGTGSFALVNPQYRILDATKATAIIDWTDALWDADTSMLTAIFDTTDPLLLAGNSGTTYYLDLKGAIGNVTVIGEIPVVVKNLGP